jgi:protoheme ferro-lyase
MAITKFTQQKDDAFDDNQRLMCSVHGCPKPLVGTYGGRKTQVF